MAEADHHPSALRNRQPILEQLQRLCAKQTEGLVLEVSSGTGCHVEAFAPEFPQLTFQPSEYLGSGLSEAEQGKIGSRGGLSELDCINSHGCEKFQNVLPAVALDVSAPWDAWPEIVRANEGRHRVVYCSNVLHITPWGCTTGLLSGAGRALADNGKLLVYGPFKVDGKFVGPDDGAGNAKYAMQLELAYGRP